MRVDVRSRVGSKRNPVAYCPEIHDLVLSKLVAGRERDIDYARQAKAYGMVNPASLDERVADLPVSDNEDVRARVAGFKTCAPARRLHREPLVFPRTAPQVRLGIIEQSRPEFPSGFLRHGCPAERWPAAPGPGLRRCPAAADFRAAEAATRNSALIADQRMCNRLPTLRKLMIT